MTYEQLADKIATQILTDVIYLYKDPEVVDYDDEEIYEQIYDIVFGELVDQYEMEEIS